MDFKIIKKIFFDTFKIDQIKYGESTVLTFAHDNDRSFLYNGKYYSPLIDTLEDDLKEKGLSCISIARIASTVKGDISYGNVHSPEGGFARALLVKRFYSLFAKKKYPYSYMEEKVWGKILDETKATKAIGILPSRELCVACHKRGIWVADVQHGVIAENHSWYGRQFREKDKKEYLPNAFLVWDRGSAEVLEAWTVNKGIAVDIIGNRWLARFRKSLPNDILVKSVAEKFDAEFVNENRKKRILVSLSWETKGLANKILSEEIIKAIKATSDKYQWLIRLHPNQVKGFAEYEFAIFYKLFQQELKDFASWELATSTPLPAVLSKCDLHVSWNSSIAIEAAQLGIKSAMLDPDLTTAFAGDYYDYYMRRGYIDFVKDDSQTLVEWIGKNIDAKLDEENYDSYDAKYQKLLEFLVK